MRTSVGDVKRQRRGLGSALQDVPKPGTRLRKLYDMFLDRPLTPIHIDVIYPYLSSQNMWGKTIEQLAGYELDIRRHSSKRWWLVATEDRDYLGEAVDRQA